jgi:hypothetical protein
MARWQKGSMKFDDPELRERFLENVHLLGYDELAAVRSGLHYASVVRWAKMEGEDQKEFNELWKLAHLLHSQEKAERLQREAMEGHEEPIYDKEGKRVGTKRKYETPLRVALLKRHDAAFKDSVDITHKTDTGVMVMPQPVGSVSEWAQLVKKAKEEADARLAEEKKGRES